MEYALRRGVRILRDDGPVQLFVRSYRSAYNRGIAPLLPRRAVRYNGVPVPNARLFDEAIPWRTREDRPQYESGLIAGITEHVEPGDDVVIVGGGWGVTAVEAAAQVGEDGHVTVYEGALEQVANVRDTVEWNGYGDAVTVVHAIVGSALNLRGDQAGAAVVTPGDLPECDVLELDCEGAEIGILEALEIAPETILVETHGRYDAPTDAVEALLNAMGYSVVSRVVADADQREKCERDDIRILTAKQ